jgi:hypothetical protein
MSIGSMVQRIVALGSNCVRLPFSIELWTRNPTPQPFAIQGVTDCRQNSTAMGIFDCVVEKLTDAGIMVILNNHNSFSGWVGLSEAQQGLWDLPGYNVSVWLDCLQHMAARYRDNKLVVGMDIRNEIHDHKNVLITWGESSDITTDWKAASTMASARIESVNPDMLIIVTGLCYGYDFNDIKNSPGPANALHRNKLVYTSHVYIQALWWSHIGWGWVVALAVLLLFSGAALCNFMTSDEQFKWLRPDISCAVGYIIGSIGPFVLFWGVLLVVYYHILSNVGCHAYVQSLKPPIWNCFGMFVLSVVCIVGLEVFTDPDSFRVWCFLVGVGCCVHAVGFLVLAILTQTSWMVRTELDVWNQLSAPVWVGEFGAMWTNDSPIWNQILAFINDNDLNFAYWAVNGLKWSQESLRYVDEPFGLLTSDYNATRNPKLISKLFG